MRRIEIDVRGQVCPSTLLTVLNEVNKHHSGLAAGESCLVIYSDNRAATGTVPPAVDNMGLASEIERKRDYYKITICRNGANREL